jgi:hypothetical protein
LSIVWICVILHILCFIIYGYCESIFIRWNQFSWLLWFLNSLFQTVMATVNGKNIYFVEFLFSWLKWTTKSAKIRTSWLLMISQYMAPYTGLVRLQSVRSTHNHLMSEWVTNYCLLSSSSGISWREQVHFQWDDDEDRFELDQHA